MSKQHLAPLTVDEVNRQLYERNAELAVRNKTLSLLHKIGNVTRQILVAEEMVRQIALLLDKEFSYPLVVIGLCDDAGHKLVWKGLATVAKQHPLFSDVEKLHAVKLSSRVHPVAVSLRSKKRLVVSSPLKIFTEDVSEVDGKAFAEETRIKSTLIFPLVFGDRPIGTLVVGLDYPSKDLTRYEKETFQSLLNLITLAIQKAETYDHLQHTTKELKVANKHLRELDGVKTEFLSIASHQLRTPLAVVKGYIGLLKDGMLGTLVPKQKDTLAKMEAGTEQLIMLVNHLLDVSRIEAHRLQVRLEPVEVGVVLDGLVKFIQGKADEKKLTLTYTMPTEPMNVNVDIEKVKEVYMNLLDNAVKYTDQGTVAVTVSAVDGQVEVRVTDSGAGLTANDLDHLFQKFVTGSASAHVKTTTGLGLYVCKKLTEAMGGTIFAESKGTGKGSTFVVRFPVLSK